METLEKVQKPGICYEMIWAIFSLPEVRSMSELLQLFLSMKN